ncbi:GGDEF domain-containing protein [Leucothrix mucor]|uniref:GGDEF domain-containing protein n=1 Tax=Leucothrix mucor TaxID=45248 RepID=UPI0003B47C21|nr:GGDEF domain-containing protein [Leucothrix mucor]
MKKCLLIILVFQVLLLPRHFAFAQPTESSLEHVSLQLSWKHQFQFAGYYAAVAKGFYREVGLDVRLLEGGQGSRCDEQVLSQVEYCNASGSVVKLRLSGQPIVMLASIIQHSPIVLITQKHSDLKTPHDLIGKRVEVLLSGQPVPEIYGMLKNEGIAISQLMLYENSVGIQALLNNEVDALYGFSTNELYQLQQSGLEFNVISPQSYGVDFYGDVLLTSESEVRRNPEQVKQFRAASLKGWRYAMAHQEEIVDLILRDYPASKTREALLAEAQAIEKLMLPNLIQIGHTNPSRWKHTADTLVSLGLAKPNYSLDGFIYEIDEGKGYLWLLRLLGASLLLASVAAGLLWLFNRRLTAEVETRMAALERLRKVKDAALEKAYTDELSGMGNRRAFFERGKDLLGLANSDLTPVSAIVLDIDHFKRINDDYGHAMGDEAIRVIARVILNMIRATDIQGRIGGEEFAVMLPQTELKGAMELAERMRLAIEQVEIERLGIKVSVTASIGVSTALDYKDDINSLVQRADNALYCAKRAGRNQVVSA